MTEEDIISKCEWYMLHNYKINDDMSVDVNDDVSLDEFQLSDIPLNFNKVSGFFKCHINNLTSLYGSPKYVGYHFRCNNNRLTDLKFSPVYVEKDFTCNSNMITTLNDLPVNFHVGGNFDCYANHITDSKEFSKLLFGYIGGKIYTDNQDISDFLNNNKNPPKKDLPRLLSELRKIKL